MALTSVERPASSGDRKYGARLENSGNSSAGLSELNLDTSIKADP